MCDKRGKRHELSCSNWSTINKKRDKKKERDERVVIVY